MRNGDKLPYWPAMMLRKTAMAYCDMSEVAFLREVATGVFPNPIKVGARLHWSRNQLDAAIDQLFGKHELKPSDWRKDSWIYADDPQYHPELRKKSGKRRNDRAEWFGIADKPAGAFFGCRTLPLTRIIKRAAHKDNLLWTQMRKRSGHSVEK